MQGKFFRSFIKLRNLPEVVRSKWDDSLLDEGVVPFPKKVMRHMTKVLTGKNALKKMMLITTVADFKRPNYSALPSVDYLAYTSGMDREEFMKILNEMREENLLEYQEVDDRIKIKTHLFTQKIISLDTEERRKEIEEFTENETPF